MCVLFAVGNCHGGPHIDFMTGRYGPVEIWTRAGLWAFLT